VLFLFLLRLPVCFWTKKSQVQILSSRLILTCGRDAICVYPTKGDGNPYSHFLTAFLIRNGGCEGGGQAVCLLPGDGGISPGDQVEMQRDGIVRGHSTAVNEPPGLANALTPPSAIGSSMADDGPEPTLPDPNNLALWSRARLINYWRPIIEERTGNKKCRTTRFPDVCEMEFTRRIQFGRDTRSACYSRLCRPGTTTRARRLCTSPQPR
jgi:hypothetical protein